MKERKLEGKMLWLYFLASTAGELLAIWRDKKVFFSI